MNLECSGKSTTELQLNTEGVPQLKCRNNSFGILHFKCCLLKGRIKDVTEQNRYPAEKNFQIQKCQAIEQWIPWKDNYP